ncbi:MAG: peptide-methionine (S)-S-oxide reductase, partial [Cyanobacteria bacterium P01_A01_bin.83]
HNPEQEQIARKSKQQLQQSGKYERDIVTEIKPAKDYYLATEEHQQYLLKKQNKANLF